MSVPRSLLLGMIKAWTRCLMSVGCHVGLELMRVDSGGSACQRSLYSEH